MIRNHFILQMRPTLSYKRDQPASCCWGSQSLALASWSLISAPCKLATICHWLSPLGSTWNLTSRIYPDYGLAFVPLLNFESDFWSCRSLLSRVLTLGSHLVSQLCSQPHVLVLIPSPQVSLESGAQDWAGLSALSRFKAAPASDLPDFPPAPPAGSLLHRLLGFTHSS